MTIHILSLINLTINIIYYSKYLHLYQLKDYNNKRYLALLQNKFKFLFVINILTLIILTMINLINFNKKIKNLIIFAIYLSILIINLLKNKKLIKNNKTPIKYTKKLIRLYVISSIILTFTIFFDFSIIISNILLIFMPIISNFINFYDKIKNHLYIKQAVRKLKFSNTKIIAITGSNGKTSVKNILYSMLSKKYNTLATPKSYNTPLGISSFINKTLDTDCEYLILEYGARRRGDIKKLCRLFGADYGIITTISPQHLQTFRSIENIYLTKKELSDFLNNKLCIYNRDNLYTYRMYLDSISNTNNPINNKISSSILINTKTSAKNIHIKNYTTYFDLILNNKSYSTKTKLLGDHNISNIILSTSLALTLGITIEDIISTIENLTHTEHRLEYIRGYINILDDSYNCSLLSAKESLKVLSFCPNKKMIVTPGIIEGGKKQFSINKQLGQMCQFADFLIIVGNENKEGISLGFNDHTNSKLIYAKDLEDAKQYFRLLSPDDTILLLNDLPDDYN